MVVTGGVIQAIVDRYIGSNDWNLVSTAAPGPGTDKCHLFVDYIFKQAGVRIPKKWKGLDGPITAMEWGDSKCVYLIDDNNWINVAKPYEGDVISDGKHVGIISGYRATTHTGPEKIIRDNWGFKPSQALIKFVFWRYKK